MSESPPSSAGALHDTVTGPLPSGLADTSVGPAGTCGGAGVPVPVAVADGPTEFDAAIVTEYAVPSARPLIVALVADAFAVAVMVFLPLADAVSLYPVTGFPPFIPGGVQDTMSAPGRPNTETISGACGTWAASGTTGLAGGDAGLVPPALTAATLA